MSAAAAPAVAPAPIGEVTAGARAPPSIGREKSPRRLRRVLRRWPLRLLARDCCGGIVARRDFTYPSLRLKARASVPGSGQSVRSLACEPCEAEPGHVAGVDRQLQPVA